MSHKYKGIFFAIASASLFGLSPLWVTTFTSGGGNSMMMAFIRNLFFLPVCALLLHRREGRVFMPVSKAAARGLVILSLFGSGMTQLLLFASYSFMASGICTTVHFIYPLFVFLMSAIFYGQKMTPKTVFCLALCMAGLMCFYPSGSAISFMGLAIALLSGITYAFYMVYLDRGGFEGISPLRLQFYVAVINAALMLCCCLVTGNFVLDLAPSAWLCGIAASQILGFAVVLCQIGIKEIGAEKASLLSTFEPITSLVVGVLFLKESLDPIAFMGAAVILLSVLVFNLPEGRLSHIHLPFAHAHHRR